MVCFSRLYGGCFCESCTGQAPWLLAAPLVHINNFDICYKRGRGPEELIMKYEATRSEGNQRKVRLARLMRDATRSKALVERLVSIAQLRLALEQEQDILEFLHGRLVRLLSMLFLVLLVMRRRGRGRAP